MCRASAVMMLVATVVVCCGGAALNENIDYNIKVDSDSKLYHQGKTVEGSFNYGYDVPRQNFNQYQHKVKGPDGVTYGCYGFVDPTNGTHLYHYVSDLNGYRLVAPNKPTRVYVERVAESVANIYNAVGVTYDWEKLYFPDVCRVLQKSKEQTNTLTIPPGVKIQGDGSLKEDPTTPRQTPPPAPTTPTTPRTTPSTTPRPTTAPRTTTPRTNPPNTRAPPTTTARTTTPPPTTTAPVRRVPPTTPSTTPRPTPARRVSPSTKPPAPRAPTTARPAPPPPPAPARPPPPSRSPVTRSPISANPPRPSPPSTPRSTPPRPTPARPNTDRVAPPRDKYVSEPTTPGETLKAPNDLVPSGQDIYELKMLVKVLLEEIKRRQKAGPDCDDASALGTVDPNAKHVFLPLVIVDTLPGARVGAPAPAGLPAGSQFAIPSVGYGAPRCNTCG